jgi:hypothetical protein
VVEARHTRQALELNLQLSPTLDVYARRAAPRVAVLVTEVIAETSSDPDSALREFLEALIRFAHEDRGRNGPAFLNLTRPSRLHRLLPGVRG